MGQATSHQGDATARTQKITRALRIAAPKLALRLADHFRAQIVSGELDDGDFFPNEATLVEALGVSRPTLREAMRILESEGLVSIAAGTRSGARVHRPSLAPAARAFGHLVAAHGLVAADIGAARRVLLQHHEQALIRLLDAMLAEVDQSVPRPTTGTGAARR